MVKAGCESASLTPKLGISPLVGLWGWEGDRKTLWLCLETQLGELHPRTHTTSMRQMVVSTSLGWETTTSEVANTFTSALSFCSVTDGGLGTWILMVSGRDSGYCWNTCGRHQTEWVGSSAVDFCQSTSKHRVGQVGEGSSAHSC